MTDVVSRETRSRMMSGIRGKDTKPELIVRKGLHSLGFRYKLHDRALPGTPDLVFPKYFAVIQVQGCFWHGHECDFFKWPQSRREFWYNKITANHKRDRGNLLKLKDQGWRALVIWECSIKGKQGEPALCIERAANWLVEGGSSAEISTNCEMSDLLD